MVAATALNIVLNLLWIPEFGLVGAAAATLVSECAVLTALLFVVLRLGVRPRFGPMLRVAAAAAALALFLGAWGSELPIAASIPAGAGVYLAALVALRAVPQDALTYARELSARMRGAG